MLLVHDLLQDCADVTLSECLKNDKYRISKPEQHASGEHLDSKVASNATEDVLAENATIGKKSSDRSKGDIRPGTMLRVFAGLILLSFFILSILAYHYIDQAPAWLTRIIISMLDAHPDQVSSSEGGLSKLLQYKLDQQLSNAPSFKVCHHSSCTSTSRSIIKISMHCMRPLFTYSLPQLVFLAIITGALIINGALALFVSGEDSIYSAFWLAVAGSGLDWTFSDKALEGGWNALMVRGVSLMVSVGGMLVTALLLGLVSDAIGEKLDELKRGKAGVLESGHTLIIG